MTLEGVAFPDAAGEHQRAGRTAALIQELGDRYDKYHHYLAQRLAETGGRPRPSEYENDLPGYARASQRIDDLLAAEGVLRLCRRFRVEGVSLRETMNAKPYVDAEHRLLDVVDGKPTAGIAPMEDGDAKAAGTQDSSQ